MSFNIRQVKVRLAKLKDFDSVTSLLDELTKEIDRQSARQSVINESWQERKKIFNYVLRSSSKLFVAEYKKDVVGVLNLQILNNVRYGTRRGQVEEIIVKESYRRKGVGSKLMAHVKKWSKKNKINIIKVFSRNELKGVQIFFMKNGFSLRYKGYWLNI